MQAHISNGEGMLCTGHLPRQPAGRIGRSAGGRHPHQQDAATGVATPKAIFNSQGSATPSNTANAPEGEAHCREPKGSIRKWATEVLPSEIASYTEDDDDDENGVSGRMDG